MNTNHIFKSNEQQNKKKKDLSYDVASGSEIKTSTKIEKTLAVYTFSANVMKWRFKRYAYGKTLTLAAKERISKQV